LAELTEYSPVREVIEQVIKTLVVQLKELEKQLRAAVSARMPSLLDLSGVGPVVAGTVLAEVGDLQRFPSADHFAKSVHSRIGHSRYRRGGKDRLSLQSFCYLGRLIDLA
jgi:transposase